MVPVSVLTLIMSPSPAPSILVLQPTEDMGTKRNSRVVPIWVGVSEATMLGIALEKARFKRPMTHDLFVDALTGLDALVDHVAIYDVKGPTFYAELALRARGRIISLDARPSDAISLALREEAPILIDGDVLERASFPYLFNDDVETSEQVMADFHDFVEQITPADFADQEQREVRDVLNEARTIIDGQDDVGTVETDGDASSEGDGPNPAPGIS